MRVFKIRWSTNVNRCICKAIVLFATSLSLTAATYYIDYQAGNDRNSGLSKSSSWKHCPAMEPFGGTYSFANGDKFVFKGGVVWPNAALPLLITRGGVSGNPAYFGVDTNWYQGIQWARPIFDGQGVPFVNHGGNRGNVIMLAAGVPYLTIDGLEIRNFVWTDPIPTSTGDGFAVCAQNGSDITVKNVYVHDWVVKTTKDSKFGGISASGSKNTLALNCIIDAPNTVAEEYRSDATGHTSGVGVMHFGTVDGCEIVGTTQGIWGGRTVRNNIVRNGQRSYDGVTHENGVWIQNTADFYNNRIYNTSHGVGAYFLPGWGNRSGHRMNIYNNVFYNTAQINLTPQESPDAGNQIWFFNNIVAQASYCIQVGTTKSGAAFKTLVIQNNIFISEFKYSRPYLVVALLDLQDLGDDYRNSNNIVFTKSEAASLGMSIDNFFQNGEIISELLGKGINHSSITQTDFFGVQRPEFAAWDLGAYQFAERPDAPTGVAIR